MAQAGMHALTTTLVKPLLPNKGKAPWLLLGVILGNLFPDLDNILVAVATLTKQPTEGLHRTFTHSVFTVAAAVLVFWIISRVTKQDRWNTLGIGLGVGIASHILLDLLIWFNGVELAWPLASWVNLWEGFTPAQWWMKLMDPVEFLFFGLYFLWLYNAAKKSGTDGDVLGWLRGWTILAVVLFLVFTPLAFIMQKGFMTIYGGLYLVVLIAAFVIAIRMRKTVQAMA